MPQEQIDKVVAAFKLLDEVTDYLEYHDENGADMKDLGSAWSRIHDVLERYGKAP